MSNYGRTKDYYKNVLDEYEKKENKNSLDEANNNSALSAYYQKNFLEETYTKANEDLNKNLENQQRSAYFNNEKILKYLPNNLKVNGLQNNTGVSNQAYLDANNNYQNNLNTINNNYQTNKSTLENTYNENMLKVDDNYNNALVTNKTNYWNDVTNKNNAIINMQKDLEDQASNYINDYNIGYTEEGVNKLKEYVKTQDLPDDVKSQLEAYIDNNFNISTEDEISEAEWGSKLQTNYGVTEDTTVIDNNSAGTYSFGEFNGTGEGKKQDTYITTVIQMAKDGKIANGTVVNFNYGAGKKANYVYANGKWYKTSNTATYDYKDYLSQQEANEKASIQQVTTGKYKYENYNQVGNRDFVIYNGETHKIISLGTNKSSNYQFYSDIPNNTIVTYGGKTYFKTATKLWQVVN